MSEKTNPSALSFTRLSVTDFGFRYLCNDDYEPMEEVISKVAATLRGHIWDTNQLAAIAVIGVNEYGKHYLLNNLPAEWMLKDLVQKYRENKCELRIKRINNRRIHRVIVRDMIQSANAVYLEADVARPSTAHGYCVLYPEVFFANTMSLDVIMTELMKLHMLKLVHYPAAQWLRRQYRK